jgi:D-arabinose 1-dehydrogenase-like Zn-dependent alcohol dehydrogenase
MADTFTDEAQQTAQAIERRQELAELLKLAPRQRVKVVVSNHITELEEVVPELRRVTNVRETLVQDLCRALQL